MTNAEAEGAGPQGAQPTEEELRAAYEQQIKQIRLEQIVLENVVTVLNLGMRKTGLSPGTEDERDPDQVRVAIESVRVQLPLLEDTLPNQVRQIRDALSQLQMAYVRIGGQAPAGTSPESGSTDSGAATAGAEPAQPKSGEAGPPKSGEAGPPKSGEAGPPKSGEAGPAQRSGRLWVPGQ